MRNMSRADLELELLRLQNQADEIDKRYAIGHATKADILRSERAMDCVVRKLAETD